MTMWYFFFLLLLLLFFFLFHFVCFSSVFFGLYVFASSSLMGFCMLLHVVHLKYDIYWLYDFFILSTSIFRALAVSHIRCCIFPPIILAFESVWPCPWCASTISGSYTVADELVIRAHTHTHTIYRIRNYANFVCSCSCLSFFSLHFVKPNTYSFCCWPCHSSNFQHGLHYISLQ